MSEYLMTVRLTTADDDALKVVNTVEKLLGDWADKVEVDECVEISIPDARFFDIWDGDVFVKQVRAEHLNAAKEYGDARPSAQELTREAKRYGNEPNVLNDTVSVYYYSHDGNWYALIRGNTGFPTRNPEDFQGWKTIRLAAS